MIPKRIKPLPQTMMSLWDDSVKKCGIWFGHQTFTNIIKEIICNVTSFKKC